MRAKFRAKVLPPHLLLAIAATAVRFSDDPFFGRHQAQALATYARSAWKQLMHALEHDSPRINLHSMMTACILGDLNLSGMCQNHSHHDSD